MKNNLSKLFFAAVLSTTLFACGNSETSLPDDPSNEPVAEQTQPPADVEGFEEVTQDEAAALSSSLTKYKYVDPKHLIQSKHLNAALAYYDKNLSKLKNKKYLSVIDFSKSSKLPRFFIINMTTGSVWAIHTAHGKGSDANHDGYAEKFSNVSGSNASSLGFYLTAETYTGSHGYSLRLDGLSSTNSNVRARAIVIHGASYVQEASVIQGRSWGCPAVANDLRTKVIGLLKGGSLIYAGN
jgi:hypothetical protein